MFTRASPRRSGIDKPQIRLVVHWTLPPTPEAYYQEAGHAGRDGQFARCVPLWRRGDAARHPPLPHRRGPGMFRGSLLPNPGLRVSDPHNKLQADLAERYVLERELGRGGMATVYLAHDLRHKRSVALKVLLPDLAQTLGPDRFQREIETAARLQHPHILTVLDSGEAAGQLWFTMPFVEGESLRDRLRRERQLSVDDAVRITLEAAQALQYAHEHGVIHRDIKPENLLLTRDGNTLVADFGIARGGADDDERLTSTGVVIGTPAYMSPEQGAGDRQVDARSDLYSLGCVLYEMLAGEPPFTAPTMQALIVKRLTEPAPSVRRTRPSVPEHVEQALSKALAPVAADRFPNATEFARALQAGPTGPGTGQRVASAPAVLGKGSHRLPVAATALGLGFLIGLGVLFAWRRSHSGLGDAGGAKVVAVLPFENLGDSAQAYFADGVGDEVRGKLSQLPGLVVIARASSSEYRHTNKPPQQVARELGADYLLTGTVRWEKHPDGTSRVRVSPELVRIAPNAAPRTTWQQGFDAPLTDVFQVQADIASQVAQAMNVALGDSTKRVLAVKPTQSLPAYDAFLRGDAALHSDNPGSERQALAAFEQAVALDSTFVEAWAQLAEAQRRLYSSNPTPAGAEAARIAAERALAVAPLRPEGHLALSKYYYSVVWDDLRGFTEDSIALALAPTNAAALKAMGWDELYLGRWEDGRRHLEQAVRLDPRSAMGASGLEYVLLYTRHYAEAEQTSDRRLQLEPANLGEREYRILVALAQGDVARAQAVLKATPKEVDPTALVAHMANHNELYWLLDEAQQQLLLRLRPSAFDDDVGSWGIVLAQTYSLRGNRAKAHTYADSARIAFEQQLQATPQDPQRHTFLGLSLAYLGRKEEAIREGKRGVTLMPISRDALVGPYLQHQLARIYLLVSEPEKALDVLEPLLKIPYHLSPAWLKIDPNFAQLRGNPRFERLVNGT